MASNQEKGCFSMCTALSLRTKDHYFGRTLDLDRFYGEEVCVIPRHFPLEFRKMGKPTEHYAMIGMATVVDGTPLLYEGANEHGLAMAGLNFPGNAWYGPVREGKDNVTPFELLPWILGQCKTLEQAQTLLERIHLVDIPFSRELPLTPLHWMIADRNRSLVVESRKSGLHIHENPVGVLTNNPPFALQLENWEKYRHLRTDNAGAVWEQTPDHTAFCQGLGAVGLPGDVSSMSRFVRIAFGREHSVCDGEETASVGQFFHLLGTVEMVRGTCKTDTGHWDITGYTACINTDRGLYYYTTYGNQRISCVDMHRTDMDGDTLSRFPLQKQQSIDYQN